MTNLDDLQILLQRMEQALHRIEQALQAYTLRANATLTRIERNTLVLQVQGIDIMATQAELATVLEELSAQATATADQLLKAQTEIVNAIQNAGLTTPEVDAAVGKLTAGINALKAMAQAMDDLNPDQTP